jgi:hypothetical protein
VKLHYKMWSSLRNKIFDSELSFQCGKSSCNAAEGGHDGLCMQLGCRKYTCRTLVRKRSSFRRHTDRKLSSWCWRSICSRDMNWLTWLTMRSTGWFLSGRIVFHFQKDCWFFSQLTVVCYLLGHLFICRHLVAGSLCESVSWLSSSSYMALQPISGLVLFIRFRNLTLINGW